MSYISPLSVSLRCELEVEAVTLDHEPVAQPLLGDGGVALGVRLARRRLLLLLLLLLLG